jgi:hypothetical protein
MTMTAPRWQPQRPCPIPGHPQHDDLDEAPQVITETAWRRLAAWLAHAPAERLPLPAVLLTWPAAWIMHELAVPVLPLAWATIAATIITWLFWASRHRRVRNARQGAPEGQGTPARALFWPTEAALVAAVWGSWIAVAVVFGPTARPGRWPTVLYLAGAAGGYWWLRRHDAVRAARRRRDQAAADLADKRAWHQILARIGLDGWHVQERRPTNLGEERLITTSPENALASRIAANGSAIAEKLAHILGLPYGRIDLATTEFPGELIIAIRTVDVSVRDAAYHPMTTPWPEAEPSPFADWFPPAASIRDSAIWGFSPEDGSALAVQLLTAIGGRTVGVIGMTGSGKSNLLNNVREHVTRCADARLVQLNGAHMGDELTWEPLSALTLCGPVATDEKVRADIAEALAALCLLVTNRSATLAQTGHSTFQPTDTDPAVAVVIDEVDEIVKHVPGAGAALEFLASKQRKSALCLLLATQRAIIAALGGGAVRANMSEVLVGTVARATESRHATGAETEIPDIRDYSKGVPGYFQSWDPHAKAVTGRGRAFLLGKPPEELAYIKRLVSARTHLRDWAIPDLPPLALDGGQAADVATADATAHGIAALRARLAGITQPAPPAPAAPAAPAVPPSPAVPIPLGIPPQIGPALLRLLDAPEGTTASAAGLAIGKSKTVALEYLALLRDRGIATTTGGGRATRWHRTTPAAPPAPAPAEHPAPPGFVTVEALADAVHDGLVDVDDETREVFEQARQIRDRQRAARPHLTVVHPPDDDAAGDAT